MSTGGALMLSMYFTLLFISWAPVLYDLQCMQGTWRVTINGTVGLVDVFPKGMLMRIQGNRIISLESDQRSRDLFPATGDYELNQMGIDPFTKPKTIGILWSEGIYEVTHNQIRFSIKYHGQGVEGEAARRWKMPVDFAVKAGQSVWVFERVKK